MQLRHGGGKTLRDPGLLEMPERPEHPVRRGRLFAMACMIGFALALGPPVTGSVVGAAGPKVAVIVGPSGSATARYRDRANAAASRARGYGANVVKVYSPNATWHRVRSALSGASVVIYFGRGRGFPSPYSSSLDTRSQDGFALNALAGSGNKNAKFYGEYYIRRVSLAWNAVVLIHKAAYAAGTGEPRAAQPSLSVARRRVDNYGAGFMAAGAAAVIAEKSGRTSYYLRSLFTRTETLGAMWRASPTAHGHVRGFVSTRTPGAKGRTDPVRSDTRYYRSIVGRLDVSTASVRSVGSPGAGTYGSGINADSLGNSVVGGAGNTRVAYRFRATESARLDSVRIYVVGPTHVGYGAGTGGTWEITVQTDDGRSGHAPSGTVLASTTYRPADGMPLISWSSPATLTAGHLYHVVFRNVDPDPAANYASVDGLFTHGDLSIWQPILANVEWANLIWSGGSWSDDRGAGRGVITPIMQLNYASGQEVGVGYMEVWVGLPKPISGSHSVREIFTVSGSNRAIRSVSVRLKRESGTSPLRVRLASSDGTIVEDGSIAASAISTSGRGAWATLMFSTTRTLVAGRQYRLVLTSAADTSYSIFVIRKGVDYHFAPTTYFADGFGQYTAGAGWVGFDQPGGAANLDQGDLQFYFR